MQLSYYATPSHPSPTPLTPDVSHAACCFTLCAGLLPWSQLTVEPSAAALDLLS